MKTGISSKLDSLQLSDVYSLMFFLLYKVQDIPEYATLSEMCYLLDGNNMTRLLTYFAGKTVKVPTADEFSIAASALLLYQYVNVEGDSLAGAQSRINGLTAKQKEKATDLYLKMLPEIGKYNIDRSQISKDER